MTDGRERGSGEHPKGKTGGWKRAFLTLAFINIAVIFIVLAMIFLPAGGETPFLGGHPAPLSGTEPRLIVTATAEDLNGVVNRLLAAHQHKNLRYRIEFGDPIRILGTLQAFGHGIELEARFRPEVTESGDLVLAADGMRIGRLPAPASKILSYVRTYYKLPEWIVIENGGERVALYLSRMPAGDGMTFRVLEMDAGADRYRFAWVVDDETE